MSDVLTLLGGIAIVLLITLATGYFVAQEFAFMAVDRSRLKTLAEGGDGRARRALAVTKRTSFMLSGAQLGITVTGLLVGYVAEPLIGRSLGNLLGGDSPGVGAAAAIGAITALALSTVIQMIFGELFPKNLAIARPEPVALRLAGSTTAYLRLMGWLIWFFDTASNALLRAVRIEPVHDLEHAASARDLEHIVAESRQSGDLPGELSVMIDRILDFPNQDVEHAMIPRSRVGTISDADTVGQLRAVMAAGHSRYPVLAEQTDEIVGVVHLGDLLAGDHPDSEPVTTIARPALVVATLMALPDALDQLNATGNQLACVVDEHGGFAGILTLEDLAEEVVGEITDEPDPVHVPHWPVPDDGIWLLAGEVHIDEVERSLGLDLPAGDYETIAGLAIARHGRLPEPGTALTIEIPADAAALALDPDAAPTILLIEVLEVERYVPAKVRLTILPSAGSGHSAAAEGRGNNHG